MATEPSATPTPAAPVVQTTQAPVPPAGGFIFAGSPGHPFVIQGPVGPARPVVLFGAIPAELTSFNAERVKGFVPADVKHGTVEISVNGKKFTAKL